MVVGEIDGFKLDMLSIFFRGVGDLRSGQATDMIPCLLPTCIRIKELII